MKKILTTILALGSMALLMLPSCKKDGALATSNGGKAGTLSASTTSLVLDKTKLYDPSTIISFNFTAADYGYSAAVTNTLQVDVASDNWAKPVTSIVAANTLSAGYSTADFNALLLKLGLPAGTASPVLIRIAHSISANIAPVYSNVVSVNATPFNLTSYLWVPGAYEGWHPSKADSLISPTSNNIYNGIVNFTGSDLTFKVVTSNSESWNGTNYGIGATAGTISSSGNNLTAPADGGLLVGVNLTTNTITFTPQWSIIGDATPGGWSTDTNMLFDAVHNTWYVTAKLVSNGTSNAIKFRFNNAWTVNLGGSGGTLTSGGANIVVPVTAAGGDNYLITLDPVANTYTLVKQ